MTANAPPGRRPRPPPGVPGREFVAPSLRSGTLFSEQQTRKSRHRFSPRFGEDAQLTASCHLPPFSATSCHLAASLHPSWRYRGTVVAQAVAARRVTASGDFSPSPACQRASSTPCVVYPVYYTHGNRLKMLDRIVIVGPRRPGLAEDQCPKRRGRVRSSRQRPWKCRSKC